MNNINEKRDDTYSVVRYVNVGDFSGDKMEIDRVTGDINKIKRDVEKKHGKVLKVDKVKKEIILESTRRSISDGILDGLHSNRKTSLNEGTNGRVVVPFENGEIYKKNKEVQRLADEVSIWTKKNHYRPDKNDKVETTVRGNKTFVYVTVHQVRGQNVECLELESIVPFSVRGTFCLKRATIYPDGKVKKHPDTFKVCTEDEIIDAIK